MPKPHEPEEKRRGPYMTYHTRGFVNKLFDSCAELNGCEGCCYQEQCRRLHMRLTAGKKGE